MHIIECKLNELVFTKVGIAEDLCVRVPQSVEALSPYGPQLKLTLEMSVGGLVYGLEQMVSRHFGHKQCGRVITSRESYEVSAKVIAGFVVASLKAETSKDFLGLVAHSASFVCWGAKKSHPKVAYNYQWLQN